MADDPFITSLDAWIGKALDRADRVTRLTAQLALARIKELTPVQTGYLRANWAIVRGSGAMALQDARAELSQQVILQLQLGDIWSLVNPTRYAARVEFGFVGTDSLGRHYDQKGVHMLQQVKTELPLIVARAAAIVAMES